MIFTPRPYQEIGYQHILNNPYCALWAGMGMGKTSTTLSVLSALNMVKDVKALVLAPVRVARDVWPQELRKWDDFSDLKIVHVTGDQQDRREALREPANIHTFNYENLIWLLQLLAKTRTRFPWDIVVADESTRLKSFRLRKSGRRARALALMAKGEAPKKFQYLSVEVERFIELTGTPSPNGLQDLWGQMWFLDKGARLGRTHSSFIQRWFSTPNPEIRSMIRPLPHAQVEIEDRVKDICLSLKAEDWFDIKEPIVVDIPVYLPTAAREAYDSMESEMFAQIESGEVEANNAAAKSIKCLQIANGAIYTDEEQHNWQEVHSEKIQALESIVEETDGTPLLVAYHFRHDLARLKKAFPLARELDKHPSTIVDWNKGLIPMLLVHPESAGHGLNLQDGGNIIVMFGHWWNLESYQQVIERIGPVRQLQSGHNRPVYIYNIRAVDTIDGVVISRRNNKRAVQDLLLESAKRR